MPRGGRWYYPQDCPSKTGGQSWHELHHLRFSINSLNIKNPSTFISQIAPSDAVASCEQEEDKNDRNQRHFKTDHLLANLKGRTISSGAITVSAQAGKFFLTLISTM